MSGRMVGGFTWSENLRSNLRIIFVASQRFSFEHELPRINHKFLLANEKARLSWVRGLALCLPDGETSGTGDGVLCELVGGVASLWFFLYNGQEGEEVVFLCVATGLYEVW